MSGGDRSLRTPVAPFTNTASTTHFLDIQKVGGLRHNQRIFMMNQTDGWMGGWSGGGMWVWTVIGTLVVVLLVVLINKISKK